MARAEAHCRNNQCCGAQQDRPFAGEQEPSSCGHHRHDWQQGEVVPWEKTRPGAHGYQADRKPNGHPPAQNMRLGKEQDPSDNQRGMKPGPV
jgi:hypothetical protein